MVFKLMALDSLKPIQTQRKSRVSGRVRKTKVRASRKTKAKVRSVRATRKTKTVRAPTRIRFATRRTKVFKPISASRWQVEHQQFGIGPLVKGDLSQFGYSSVKSETERDKSIDKAVKRYGSTSVFRKLNALYVYNKNRDPVRSNIFMKDRNYVKKTHMKY